MSISTQSFSNHQRQWHHHFQRPSPRMTENNGTKLRLPSAPPVPCRSSSVEPFINQHPTLHWTNSDHNPYPTISQLTQSSHHEQQQQMLTSQLFQKHQLISV